MSATVVTLHCTVQIANGRSHTCTTIPGAGMPLYGDRRRSDVNMLFVTAGGRTASGVASDRLTYSLAAEGLVFRLT